MALYHRRDSTRTIYIVSIPTRQRLHTSVFCHETLFRPAHDHHDDGAAGDEQEERLDEALLVSLDLFELPGSVSRTFLPSFISLVIRIIHHSSS
jgi:hypothetical protein